MKPAVSVFSLYVFVLSLLVASPANATPYHSDTHDQAFCVRTGPGDWAPSAFLPLIDVHADQTIVRIQPRATTTTVRVRRVSPEYALTFVYQFDERGILGQVHGTVERRGVWFGDTVDYADSNGRLIPASVSYQSFPARVPIAQPEDASHVKELLALAPVYQSLADVPCMTATQGRPRPGFVMGLGR